MKTREIILITLLVLINSCKNNVSGPDNSGIPQLPALADSIPYTKLGSGKIAFQRIGPVNNSYEGTYVIDINNQKSWGITLAPIDGPQISPGGDMIAFTKYTDQTYAWDVYMTDTYGNNLTRISSVKGQEFCPFWFPDNKKIVYSSYSFNTNEVLPVYIYDINAGTTNEVMDLININYPYVYSPMDNICPSSHGILVTSLSGGKGICTFNENGQYFKTIVNKSDGYNYYSSAWNPSGNKIAVMALKRDSLFIYTTEMNIILFNSDGSDSTKIFTSADREITTSWSGNSNYSLCWSPDGSKILFNRREGYLTSHIYMINADGTGLTTVTSLTGVTDRSLSWGK